MADRNVRNDAGGGRPYGRPRLPAGLAAVVAGVLASLLAACTGPAPVAKVEEAAPVVRLFRVGDAAYRVERAAAGTVRLRRETPLAFVHDGRIERLAVRQGDRVAAGQLLAALDRTAIDAAAGAAAADRARTAAELQRLRTLYKQGWVTKARVEAAEAAAQATDAQLTGARFAQRFAAIHAPSSGVVLARLAEPGQTVAAGTPIVVLGELASGHVLRVSVGAADVRDLRPGAVADIRFRDGAAPAMRGTVIEVAGRADAATGTFQVEFALPADAALKSGMIAEARWRASVADGALTVPATALFSARAGEGFVWRLDAGSSRVTARMVRIGTTTDRGVEILGGLAPGDRVVAGGIDRLVEGQKVRALAGAA